ncbi:LysR substrate-binding domain-containing protein [Mesorhizobium sp. AaZ16]|uniref:LysR substrate-binding domain-containing protein n=1 Tax=Mesorhizobium sp. AaZ16 TaxID=3402289 RepID=UPI00374E6A10
MQSLRHLLPSAGSLIVFEAAGRLGSFTAAGRELGMSQAAVSYAVRGLERQLGVALFLRKHRQVRLTEAGERFFADVTLGLSHIRKSAEELRAFAGGGHVTLSASTAFASFWMMPRLQQFRDDLPGIDLRIQTSDRDIDLIAEGIPLGIRGGAPADFPFYDCLRLATEEIYAVAGASYAGRNGAPKSVAELTRHRLIHLEEPFREAATWNEWFQSAGINGAVANRGLLINDYVPVIQAVMGGQGIALGWRHLTDRLVESGLLVQVTDHVMRTGKAFHVVWPKNRELSASARKVRDWLAAQA